MSSGVERRAVADAALVPARVSGRGRALPLLPGALPGRTGPHGAPQTQPPR